jgi:hypothetical protein
MKKQTLIFELSEFLHKHQAERIGDARKIAKAFAETIEIHLDGDDRIFKGWNIDDVKSVRPDLTDKQCRQVLKSVDDNHDATIGINWDVLECAADMMFDRPANFDEIYDAAQD